MSFDKLKKNRNKSLEKLTDQLSKIASKGYSNPDAEKYWRPTRDSAGNGFAILRFLPAPDGEDVPFVRIWDHGFQGPGGWYIENSLTTLGQDDPLSEYNTKLWNSGVESDKEQARKQKRRLHYIANVYIVKDSGNPENDGKVFLFKFGKKIFDKLNDMMNPSFEDEQPINPFDMWEGANFRLKIRQFEGYANYDRSEWDKPSALLDGDDAKLEALYNNLNSLSDVIHAKNFKSYDELHAKLYRVLGITGDTSKRAAAAKSAEDDLDDELDMSKIGNTADSPSIKEDNGKSDSEDDDDLAFFTALAKS